MIFLNICQKYPNCLERLKRRSDYKISLIVFFLYNKIENIAFEKNLHFFSENSELFLFFQNNEIIVYFFLL